LRVGREALQPHLRKMIMLRSLKKDVRMIIEKDLASEERI
jgi:hypothetical protein